MTNSRARCPQKRSGKIATRIQEGRYCNCGNAPGTNDGAAALVIKPNAMRRAGRPRWRESSRKL